MRYPIATLNSTRDVLVVDDEYAFRWAVARGLQRAGIEADVAENGREAIDLLQRKEYCAVLLDLSLPRGDGKTILASITPQGEGPAVFICTAYPELARELYTLDNGRFIRKTFLKPVDPLVIVGELASTCSQVH
jgi:DNA-binding response OmpR family regulator